jgi:hypothetical protein
MSTHLSVLEQYEKSKQATSSNSISQEDRLKKYFTTVLPKGVRSAEKRIRILPTKDGSSPFVEIYFHEVQVDGKWVKLFDPKQEGKPSPLNDVYDGLMMTGVEADRELARQYRSRKYYIVKVIDRDNEADGVKFWRFKFSSKGDGVFDKIYPIFKNKGDITDPEEGRDVIVTLGLSKSNNGKEYTSVSSIIPEDKSKLHEDADVSKEWVEDPMVWSDVYAKKPFEYLDMVAKGETPKWSNDAKKWISEADTQSDETIATGKSESAVKQNLIVDPQADDDAAEEDDLPF